MDDQTRRRVLDAIECGDIPHGGPSHLAALDLLEDVSDGYWERWSQDAAEHIRRQVADSKENE